MRYWPLESDRVVTSPFGPRNGDFHHGVDFGFPDGSANRAVFAPEGGRVMYAGSAQGYGGPDPAGWLVIGSDHGVWELGHIVREVAAQDVVAAGQRVARVNPDSRTNGGKAPHLHVSYMPGRYNPARKRDPIPLLSNAIEPDGDESVAAVSPLMASPSPKLTLDSSYEDVAQAIVAEAMRRDYTRDEAIAVTATAIQESSLRPRAHNPAGPWDGIYQQDGSYPGRYAADTQITAFFDRLDVKRRSPGRDDIWLNIFWLQQRPSESSGVCQINGVSGVFG